MRSLSSKDSRPALSKGILPGYRISNLEYQFLVDGLASAFAALHHIPSKGIRLNLLRAVHGLLADDGRFILSNWQFLNSAKLRGRIQNWSKAGLSQSEVDPGDFLLDWRSGGEGLRYVHHFSEEELVSLAAAAGFRVQDTFYSDGESGDLSLYQVWKIDPTH
jgi:hypothetical protein